MSGIEEVEQEMDRYMILQFDPRDAELVRFGDIYAQTDFNLSEAMNDAAAYAEQAASKGLPFQYIVVKTEAVVAYRPAAR